MSSEWEVVCNRETEPGHAYIGHADDLQGDFPADDRTLRLLEDVAKQHNAEIARLSEKRLAELEKIAAALTGGDASVDDSSVLVEVVIQRAQSMHADIARLRAVSVDLLRDRDAQINRLREEVTEYSSAMMQEERDRKWADAEVARLRERLESLERIAGGVRSERAYLVSTEMHDNYTDRARARDRIARASDRILGLLDPADRDEEVRGE